MSHLTKQTEVQDHCIETRNSRFAFVVKRYLYVFFPEQIKPFLQIRTFPWEDYDIPRGQNILIFWSVNPYGQSILTCQSILNFQVIKIVPRLYLDVHRYYRVKYFGETSDKSKCGKSVRANISIWYDS